MRWKCAGDELTAMPLTAVAGKQYLEGATVSKPKDKHQRCQTYLEVSGSSVSCRHLPDCRRCSRNLRAASAAVSGPLRRLETVSGEEWDGGRKRGDGGPSKMTIKYASGEDEE